MIGSLREQPEWLPYQRGTYRSACLVLLVHLELQCCSRSLSVYTRSCDYAKVVYLSLAAISVDDVF